MELMAELDAPEADELGWVAGDSLEGLWHIRYTLLPKGQSYIINKELIKGKLEVPKRWEVICRVLATDTKMNGIEHLQNRYRISRLEGDTSYIYIP